MTRAVIYTRISQDRESEEKGVRAQEIDCRAVATRLGWDVVDVIPDNDVGASSKSRKPRPGFARLCVLAEHGDIDAVIAYSTSRLTRRPAELERVIGWHERHGIALATVAGELDLGTANGVMLARMLAAVDANEAGTIGERVKRRALDNAVAGHANGGGSRAYGFERDGVTHRPDEIAVLREAAQRVLSGDSLRSIALDLNERSIPTSTGKPWTSTSIKTALSSPRAAGLRRHGDRLHKAIWEPVLDRATYDAVVDLLSRRVGTQGTTARRYAWTGLLTCGLCGMTLVVGNVGGKPRYICPAKPRGCGRLVIQFEALVGMLNEALLTHVGNIEPTVHTRDETESLSNRISSLTEKIERLAEDFADETLDADAYRTAYRVLADRRAEAKEKLRLARPTTTQFDPRKIRDTWATLNPSQQHDVASLFVQNVEIGPGRRGLNTFDPTRVRLTWR